MKKSSAILSTKAAFAYSLGILGVQLIFGYVNSIHSEFVRDAYQGLDPNVLYVAAAIILLGKVISCLADPIIGSIIDRSQFKGGKMRPFILFSAFPLAILTVIMFIYIPFGNLGDTAGKVVMYLYIAIMTALWNISMSFADIPSQGMLARLSPVAKERTKAAAISNTFKSIGLGIPGVMITLVTLVAPSLKADKVQSYFVTAIVVALLGTVLYLLIYWCNRERVIALPQEQVKFKEMFVELKTNKGIRIVFLCYMLGFGRNIAQAIALQASGALLGSSLTLPILGTVDPGHNASWLIGLTSAVVSALGLVAIPFINKKWGERKSFISISVLSGVLGIAGFVVYLCFPQDSAFRSGTSALWFIWIVQALVSIMYCTHNYIPTIMTADILDYQEWQTGTRKDGVDYAILSMSHKLATGISMAMGIFLVGLAGYGKEVSAKMQNIVFFAYIGLPAICSILSTIPMFFYKIDEKTKQTMHAELEVRRNAATNTAEQSE
jgi:GPH family glycoside/pentoside/hexuronide:cation symporter